MMLRAVPPPDITPHEFFTRWISESVMEDPQRRARLADTRATLQFDVEGEGGGTFTVRMVDGTIHGQPGSSLDPDLCISVDVDTWRELNSGRLSAPEAFLRRRVLLHGLVWSFVAWALSVMSPIVPT